MTETLKKYYIKETELCILLAMKGKETLYGVRLDSGLSMTEEALYRSLFAMQKKGIAGKDENGAFWIEKELDDCIELIRTAESFAVLADKDETVPEQYFYIAGDDVLMLEPTGHGSAFHMEKMTRDKMQGIFSDNGFSKKENGSAVPQDIIDRALECMDWEKDVVLQYPEVEKLIQAYDMHTRQKKGQGIKFICGMDEYIVYGGEWEGEVDL